MFRITFLASAIVFQVDVLAVAQGGRSVTEAESVLAVFTEDWRLCSSRGPQLIVGIWGDGSVVWSNDQVNGGPPYFTAQIKPQDVSAMLEKLRNVGVFDIPKLKDSHWGPDSEFTTILVRAAGKELKMTSWHEIYEADGDVTAIHGASGLGEKKLLAVLAEKPADYLHWRMTWLELRLAAANLIPKAGTETAGNLVSLGRRLSWQPTKDERPRQRVRREW
jgi:hypothetical protein